MSVFRSTTFRFAALVFLLQLASAAALILTIGLMVRQQLRADASRTVGVLRDDLRASYDAGGLAALAREVTVRTERLVTPGTVLLVVDRRGAPLAGNLDAWPPSVASGAGGTDVTLYRRRQAAAEAMHVEAIGLPGGERLLVGAIITGEARALRLLERVSGIVLSLALIFAALAAWIAARMIVERLQDPLAALNAVAAGDLDARVAEDGARDAFATLGTAINGALARVEQLMVELRVATDGLAHDLKSPLTRMRVALERAAAASVDAEAGEALDRALFEADRLFLIVQTALSITRAEAGIGRENFAIIDVAEELVTIADMYAPLFDEAGRALIADGSAHLPVPLHRELFAQAIGNLLDNSLKYGAGPIRLEAHIEEGGVAVTVEDRGPGIPPERRDEALRRFGRLDSARGGGGAGLGLSLAAAVARLHGGRLELGDAAPGLIVRVHLPA